MKKDDDDEEEEEGNSRLFREKKERRGISSWLYLSTVERTNHSYYSTSSFLSLSECVTDVAATAAAAGSYVAS